MAIEQTHLIDNCDNSTYAQHAWLYRQKHSTQSNLNKLRNFQLNNIYLGNNISVVIKSNLNKLRDFQFNNTYLGNNISVVTIYLSKAFNSIRHDTLLIA